MAITFAIIWSWRVGFIDWLGVAAGSERISYAGLQIAFAFFYSVFQGYAPDTDLDNVRNRVVGILFGLAVIAFVFHYVWPEHEKVETRNAQ